MNALDIDMALGCDLGYLNVENDARLERPGTSHRRRSNLDGAILDRLLHRARADFRESYRLKDKRKTGQVKGKA